MLELQLSSLFSLSYGMCFTVLEITERDVLTTETWSEHIENVNNDILLITEFFMRDKKKKISPESSLDVVFVLHSTLLGAFWPILDNVNPWRSLSCWEWRRTA